MEGCATKRHSSGDLSEKLGTIRISEEKLSGSPKQIVEQLNKLARKYDEPLHEGVLIRFDRAVDDECCDLTIFRKREPLTNWIRDVCESCGSEYRVTENEVLIDLLPISDKQTLNLKSSLTNGMVEICRQFRANRGRDRYDLGEKLFDLLPHSPIKWSKEAGPTETFVSYDSEHPNYKLYKRDILVLLGEPDRNENKQKIYYTVKRDDGTKWELGAEFGRHDYVENPSLVGGLKFVPKVRPPRLATESVKY